ncbi:PepSY domain-containing protein [Nocardia flavorosea]|uniref:PepSY domain-containing protein n=1 Tax=Nocardia flavorosea TaxID=53429 RepID=A0A846Y8W7_9NOCA|nr:PepSY domain-containing protein [Nocardia flavorosea]NKY54895.1 PepSY domain-containing protein [Nocardia flavorosea]
MGTFFRHAASAMRWLLVGAVVAAVAAGACLGVAAVATGSGTDHDGAPWSLVAAPGIDRQKAMDAAVAAVPGSTAVSAELDSERNTTVWEVEVVTPEGVEYEVSVDANTGVVRGTAERD